MNRSASPVLFGFNFQVNCAIVLMLDNIKSLKTVKLEGNNEDIEIALEDDSYILAQAKGIVKASDDFSNVLSKLKGALESLSEAYNKAIKIKQLIYITNSPNPLKDEHSKPIFSRYSRRKYSDLPSESQKIINKYLKRITNPLDPSKLTIQRLPFETDDPKEKYYDVWTSISYFLGELDIYIDGLNVKLHDIWQNAVFDNGTKSNTLIKISKKEILWPLIVFLVKQSPINEDNIIFSGLDECEFQELNAKYNRIIDSKSEKFEFVTKVISDYEQMKIKGHKSIRDFVDLNWHQYEDDLSSDSIDPSIRISLFKVIVSNILSSRLRINKVKISCNL